jgi:four helix bundle protein
MKRARVYGVAGGEQMPTGSDPRSTTDDPRSTIHDDEARSTRHADEKRPTSTIDEHEHEHEHDEDLPYDIGPFPHEKLDVYRVALEMAALAKELAKEIPRGHRNVADHLQRAADNTVLLIAEGANRRGQALKRQRFVEGRGEAGEVAAAADLVVILDLGSRMKAEKMKHLAGRACAMLTRLTARLG